MILVIDCVKERVLSVMLLRIGTNCAPLVADLFLFCNERDFLTFFLVIIKPI